jgi:hypothetical protein
VAKVNGGLSAPADQDGATAGPESLDPISRVYRGTTRDISSDFLD